ncbi:PREDICTED: uncharacterized protein LOC108379089 [Rhagoletis zephyria]|uniref:uncharacterized protein LOC108379089 n=1 Tax=Rhagoletis zephyria TaxID=28612 RepID=UPI00081168B6|nr:PREDICTED: uncharacterized protein LOC108379089 [Rhagoletis zephyria]XP_017490898.1 PREDICTED: uncharacterized protein LOC108379089 [Rhagoletis zephyria]XP_036321725.1 uncharacterized protein LOC118735851 [Rhagoletis pomonella]
MDNYWKVFLLLSVFLSPHLIWMGAEARLHISKVTQPTEATTTPIPPTKDEIIEQVLPKTTQSLIPDTPGVRQFKEDLISHLMPTILGQKEDESGVYVAQLSSEEVDQPCTTDRVRIQLISSSFPLPERFFHAPKRCSEEDED